MALINAVNTSLSGQTGTGAFVGATSPVLTTPDLGAATATSLQFSPPTNGLIGTTTNDNATAGRVGEFIFSTVPFGTEVPLTSNIPTDITTINLTAGDWDVFGNVGFRIVTGPCIELVGLASDISATIPAVAPNYGSLTVSTGTLLDGSGFAIPTLRFSLNAPTIIYLTVLAVFTGGSVGAAGNIFARRMR